MAATHTQSPPAPVKLGFVPSYRLRWTDWTEQMRRESIAALAGIDGVELVYPAEAPDEAAAASAHRLRCAGTALRSVSPCLSPAPASYVSGQTPTGSGSR